MILTLNGGGWTKIKSGKFLEATEDSSEVGVEREAGLPNIEGTFRGLRGLVDATGTGAIQAYRTRNSAGASYDNGVNDNSFDFNASKSNPIYGNSTAVQPNSLVITMWQRDS